MTHKKAEQNGAAPPGSKRGISDEEPLLLPSGNSCGSSGRPALSSVQKTFGNIVISIVGAGVLGMPYTFKLSGWVCGSVSLALVALACYHTMMLLIYSKRKVESEGNNGINCLGDLGYATFGKSGEFVVDMMIVLSQGGFCVAYLIFIGQNLASVFTGDDLTPGPEANFMDFYQGLPRFNIKQIIGLNWDAKAIYVWIIFPFQVWLASILSLTRLAPFSMCADIVNAAAMVVVMSDDIIQLERVGFQKLDAFTGWSSLPFVVGVAIYAFEGFGMVIPIESSMKDRSKFGITLAYAMGFITSTFIIFACLGYFAFGAFTEDIITLNLGRTWQTTVVKLALCLGLFFTFPVMMHPVHEMVQRRFNQGRPSVLMRTVTVLLIALTAVSVPHFGDFLSLLGSSVCCILSFVLPSLLHLRTHSGDLAWWNVVVDYALIAFGLVFGSWGTWSSIQNWS